jgi:hypothetical protein
MTTYEIVSDEKNKCRQCGKGYASKDGYCLSCVTKNLDEGKYDHIFKKHREKTKRKLETKK